MKVANHALLCLANGIAHIREIGVLQKAVKESISVLILVKSFGSFLYGINLSSKMDVSENIGKTVKYGFLGIGIFNLIKQIFTAIIILIIFWVIGGFTWFLIGLVIAILFIVLDVIRLKRISKVGV